VFIFCCAISVFTKRSNPVVAMVAAATRLDCGCMYNSTGIERVIRDMNDAGGSVCVHILPAATVRSQLYKGLSSIVVIIETIRMHVHSWLAFSLVLLSATRTTASDCSVSIESPQVRCLPGSMQPIFLNLATSTSLVSTTTTSASPSSSPSPRM
jgi:hypothetical protein